MDTEPGADDTDGVRADAGGAKDSPESLDDTLTLLELADLLDVGVQTLYDLRSQGRGPRGFRVGRKLRFRRSQIDVWIEQLEDADAERHQRGDSR